MPELTWPTSRARNRNDTRIHMPPRSSRDGDDGSIDARRIEQLARRFILLEG